MKNNDIKIRTENRYILHPRDQKRCTKCNIIYDGIREYFDIHKKKKDNTYQYSGKCKLCLKKIREKRAKLQKTDINLYCAKLVAQLKYRAKVVDVPFNLTKDDLVDAWNKQSNKCYYTNVMLDLTKANTDKKSPHLDFPSVDRKNPADGYTKGNVVWCLWSVNRMKNNLTEQQFLDFCKVVVKIKEGL